MDHHSQMNAKGMNGVMWKKRTISMMQKVDERPLNSRAMKRPLQVRAFPSIPPLELTLLLFLVAAVSSAPSKKERSGPNHFGSLGEKLGAEQKGTAVKREEAFELMASSIDLKKKTRRTTTVAKFPRKKANPFFFHFSFFTHFWSAFLFYNSFRLDCALRRASVGGPVQWVKRACMPRT